jgi:hypothetical protein
MTGGEKRSAMESLVTAQKQKLSRNSTLGKKRSLAFSSREHLLVDNQNCSFCEVVKMRNRLQNCVLLIEMVKNIYGTYNSESE